MPSNLLNYTAGEQICAHTLLCMSLDMDWKTYEREYMNSMCQLTIESVAENYIVFSPNEIYKQSLRELPKSRQKSTLSIARRMQIRTQRNASHSNSNQSSLNKNSMEPAPCRQSKQYVEIKPTERFPSPGSINSESIEKMPVSRNSVIIITEDPSHAVAGPSGLSSKLSIARIQSKSSEKDIFPPDSIIIKTNGFAGSSENPSIIFATTIKAFNENNKRLFSAKENVRRIICQQKL